MKHVVKAGAMLVAALVLCGCARSYPPSVHVNVLGKWKGILVRNQDGQVFDLWVEIDQRHQGLHATVKVTERGPDGREYTHTSISQIAATEEQNIAFTAMFPTVPDREQVTVYLKGWSTYKHMWGSWYTCSPDDLGVWKLYRQRG